MSDANEFRHETIHRMTRRCRDWDYRSRCIYMITLVLADRRSKAFGRIVVDSIDEDGLPTAAHCEPSALGQAVKELWWRFGEFTPEARPIACQLMPDHLHALLFVERPMKRPLGNAIGGFKTGCETLFQKLSLLARDPAGLQAQNPAGLQARNSAGGCPVSPAKAARTPRLFAPGFVDTILWRKGQLEAERAYLTDNPLRLAIKQARPELFTLADDLLVALPGLDPAATGHFSAIGNRFLLSRPIVQVQVSRRFFSYKRIAKPGGGLKIARDDSTDPIVEFSTPDFEDYRDELLARAKHGGVLLSPCISDGERQIARAALAAKLPIVTMVNKGFAPLQKPIGRLFDACSEGRLLMLAPAAWPYQPGEKPMTRFDATAMNRLCQWIAGEDAAEINYHGMRPDNIDALAREAALIA